MGEKYLNSFKPLRVERNQLANIHKVTELEFPCFISSLFTI